MSRNQKVIVVGAGPVGSLAALYAANRGHDVEIYELRGGQFISYPWSVLPQSPHFTAQHYEADDMNIPHFTVLSQRFSSHSSTAVSVTRVKFFGVLKHDCRANSFAQRDLFLLIVSLSRSGATNQF